MIAAIDFGASTTKAAVRTDDVGSLPRMIRFGGAEDFPSAVYLTRQGTLEVGRRALAYAGRNPLRLHTQVKRQVHTAGPVAPVDRVLRTGDGDTFPLVGAVAAILSHAYAAICADIGSPPARLVLTHPAEWHTREQLLLRRAAAEAGLNCPVSLLPEPEAVAHACMETGGEVPDCVAVFDLGASTFDTALLAKSPYGKWETVFCRGRFTGGDDFDDVALSVVAANLDQPHREVLEVLRADEPYGVWRAARDLKEALSADEEASFAYEAEGRALPDVAVHRDDFEDALQPLLRPCLATLKEALKATPKAALSRLLVLSGGSTAVPLVREAVQEIAQREGLKVVGDHDQVGPGHLAAWGAARSARPYRVQHARWGPVAGSGDLVALPGGRVASSGPSREIQLLGPNGEEHGSVTVGGPPDVFRHLAADGDRLVSATEQGFIETWSVPVPARTAAGERPALDWHGSVWGHPATALSLRGERMAWLSPDGAATAATVQRRRIVRLANPAALLGLAFLDPQDALLAWDHDRLFLHDPSDGRLLASAPLGRIRDVPSSAREAGPAASGAPPAAAARYPRISGEGPARSDPRTSPATRLGAPPTPQDVREEVREDARAEVPGTAGQAGLHGTDPAAERPERLAVHSAEGLILVRSPGLLRALAFGTDGCTTRWETGVSGSGPVCTGDFEGRPVVVTYDENRAALVVLDGAGGAVMARAAAYDRPDQLLASREPGTFLARTGRLVHLLDLLS